MFCERDTEHGSGALPDAVTPSVQDTSHQVSNHTDVAMTKFKQIVSGALVNTNLTPRQALT